MNKNNTKPKNRFNTRELYNNFMRNFVNIPKVQPIHLAVDGQTYNRLKQEYSNNKNLIFD